MKWDFTCNGFKRVRELITQNINTSKQCILIMEGLENCCDELTPDNRTDWIWYDEFIDLKTAIHEEIELIDEDDYEDCEMITNSLLQEFYNLCDEARVWLVL